jgi:bifunctional UDP-N-acetylglucosamine pyrophosphorylase/glucosamine-1-phosphate N-acetyltransferase
MKAVILAAGEGTRLKPITSSLPKPMIPIAGKPLLEHLILGLKEAGITDILIIVGYKKELIVEYFQNGQEIGVNIEYTTQHKYLGTAHATGYAKDFVKDDNFLMMYGDIMVDPEIFSRMIQFYHKSGADGLISLLPVDNPQSYGIIKLNAEDYVEEIIEKPSPDEDVGNLANAGIYIFPPEIFKAIDRTDLSERDEYELTDSIEILIDELDKKIMGFTIRDVYWNDVGLPWQLLEANEYVLNSISREIHGSVEDNVTIKGNVHIGEGTLVRSGSYLKGPCYIGENCLIGPNAFIRPGSSIQDNCHIGISEIKNSIVLSGSNVPHFNYIGDSIICDNVNLGAGTKVANLRFDDSTVKVTVKKELVDSDRRKLGTIVGPNVKTGINVSIMCGKKIGQNARVGAQTLVLEDVPRDTLYYQDPDEGIVKKELE